MKNISAIGIDKLTQWCYDTDYKQFVKDMGFEDFTEDYNHEKFRYMQTRLAMWLGSLSEEYLKNLVTAINNKGSRYETDNKK